MKFAEFVKSLFHRGAPGDHRRWLLQSADSVAGSVLAAVTFQFLRVQQIWWLCIEPQQ